MDITQEISGSRVRWSNDVSKLFPAIIAAQGAMGGVQKDAQNPFFKMKYATLTENIFICKGPLNDNGLALMQPISNGANGVIVTTLLIHTSGQWLSSEVEFPTAKQDAQAYGSAATYARRYSLNALLSIPFADDDAELDRKADRPAKLTPTQRTQQTAQQYAQRAATKKQEVSAASTSPSVEAQRTEKHESNPKPATQPKVPDTMNMTQAEVMEVDHVVGNPTKILLGLRDGDLEATTLLKPSKLGVMTWEEVKGMAIFFRASPKDPSKIIDFMAYNSYEQEQQRG